MAALIRDDDLETMRISDWPQFPEAADDRLILYMAHLDGEPGNNSPIEVIPFANSKVGYTQVKRQMPSTPATWRPMYFDDLCAVHALAKLVHTAYPERPEVAAERLRLAPGWCRALIGEGGVAGYIIAHPWRLGAPPRLDTLLGKLPAHPDTLYLHDIVIDPARRGRGEARAGLSEIFAAAQALFPSLSLVSIGGLTSFWETWDFEVSTEPSLRPILRSYDSDARYMVRMRRSVEPKQAGGKMQN